MKQRSSVSRPRRRLRVQDVVSSGGVVLRRDEGSIEVALCGRPSDGMWVLPKGTPQAQETLEETALREVQEETGLKTRILRSIGAIEYWFTRLDQGVRFHKVVHHFLMEPTGGDVSLHDQEYEVVRWFPIADAEALMSYHNELEMLRRAVALLSAEAGEAGEARAETPANGNRGRGAL
jgi:8-oxo-dGTP pyrophosphatase MutT (NUDIX family)